MKSFINCNMEIDGKENFINTISRLEGKCSSTTFAKWQGGVQQQYLGDGREGFIDSIRGMAGKCSSAALMVRQHSVEVFINGTIRWH